MLFNAACLTNNHLLLLPNSKLYLTSQVLLFTSLALSHSDKTEELPALARYVSMYIVKRYTCHMENNTDNITYLIGNDQNILGHCRGFPQ